MKKKFSLILSLVALTALASCGGSQTSTTTPNTGTTDTTTETTTESTTAPVEGTITFNKTSYVVERNSTTSVRVKVSIPGASNLTCAFSVVQDGEIIELPEMTEGVIAINVKGLTVGHATIVATSMANPAITASADIEVIRPLYDLGQAWRRAINYSNYTFTSKDEEGNVHNVVKVTDAGITSTKADGTANISIDSGDEEHGTVKMYGLAIDKNGSNAFYLTEDANGNFFNTGYSAKGQGVGPLNKDNFKGLGLEATSWLDVDSEFFGLQAINPKWLTSVKDSSNTYEIVGTEQDFNSAMVEALLWKLIDPTGLTQYLTENGITSYTAQDIAVKVDTTISVNIDNSITVQLENNYNKVYTATISDIGSTTLDSRFTAYAQTVEVSLPKLDDTILKMKEAFLKDDFYLSVDMTDGKLGAYQNTDYIYNDGLYSFDSFAAQLGIEKMDGVVTKDNQVYPFYVNDAQEVIIVNISLGTGTVKDMISYPSSYQTFTSEDDMLLYGFSEYPSADGSSSVFITRSQVVSDEFSEGFYGITIPEICQQNKWTFDYYLTEFTPKFTKVGDNFELTSIEISCGSFNGGYVLVPFSFDVQGCAVTNPMDAKIKAAIAAFNPTAA